MKMLICRHCGANVPACSVHGKRLHAGTLEDHDLRVRESELSLAANRAAYDRAYAFSVITRAAASRGGMFLAEGSR